MTIKRKPVQEHREYSNGKKKKRREKSEAT
jgi:hypothetical protein